ncbi:methyltransferase domain-containing protein [Rhodopila sp.]|uniref:methyltransferase domain-containing protein n=1 Tax=Rhodopila sp. TaxID=2480087 RepID=UPI003D09D675
MLNTPVATEAGGCLTLTVPGLEALGATAPGTTAAGLMEPDLTAPGFGAPGLRAPGFGAPGFGAPDLGAPGFGTPGLGAPGLGAPVLTATAVTPAILVETTCRLCGARLHRTLIDLGSLPLAGHAVPVGSVDDPRYQLHARVCDTCSLVQVGNVPGVEPISGRGSGLSEDFGIGGPDARRWFEGLRKRLRPDAGSLVIEVGCNDSGLLRQFQASGIRVLGIGVPGNAAEAGVPIELGPFNAETAMQVAVRHGCADLVIATDVLPRAHDLFDLAAALACILRPNGVLTLQVPHLLAVLQNGQFDAFRHDTHTYLSLQVLEHVLRSVGLRAFDAERVADHGGSLRVQACHLAGPHAVRPGVKAVRLAERSGEALYAGFGDRVAAARDEIGEFLRTRGSAGRRVVGYGAATRGAMLLNCCGITEREIVAIADADPARHGRLMPGSRIPIVALESVLADPPHDVMILPWPNLAQVLPKLMPLRQLGTQLWTLLPRIARV